MKVLSKLLPEAVDPFILSSPQNAREAVVASLTRTDNKTLTKLGLSAGSVPQSSVPHFNFEQQRPVCTAANWLDFTDANLYILTASRKFSSSVLITPFLYFLFASVHSGSLGGPWFTLLFVREGCLPLTGPDSSSTRDFSWIRGEESSLLLCLKSLSPSWTNG